jgi:hypothetical protein
MPDVFSHLDKGGNNKLP